MDKAKESTDCHRNGIEFYLNNEEVEETLADCVKLSGKSIPTNRFKDEKVTDYAFGDIAEQYGEFLREAEIKEMPVFLTNTEEQPFARQMWFGNLGGRSDLNGGGSYLDFNYRVRGVGKSAEGIAKNSEVYTVRDIQNVLEAKGLSGIEKILIDGLKGS